MHVVSLCVAGCAVVVVVMGVESRAVCLSLLLTEVAFRRVPFRAILCRGEPGGVAREIVVVSVGSGWLPVCVEVVFPISCPVFLVSGT